MASKVLIIAGMHRSGTSLITNWLWHCGLQVGETLLGENEGNREGHYEDLEFLRLHEEILVSNDRPANGMIVDNGLTISEYQREKVKAVLGIKERRFAEWGWKEPRTCLLFHLYRELIPAAKYLVIFRDHLAVVNSLLKREFDVIDKNEAASPYRIDRMKWRLYKRERSRKRFYAAKAAFYLGVWINYNEQILELLAELPSDDFLAVNYQLLENNDEKVFSHLTDAWSFTLSYYPFAKVFNKALFSRQFDLKPILAGCPDYQRAIAIEKAYSRYLSN